MKAYNLLLAAAGLLSTLGPVQAAQPVPVKVMIVSMFEPEANAWLSKRKMDETIAVPGLPSDHPAVHCDAAGVCQVTIGMGYANAAASMGALVYSDAFDLRHTYWLIAGIAGVNPHKATLGSVTWAHYLVDGGLEWELDARDKPQDWPSGYLGIEAKRPGDKPGLTYGTEVFELNEALVQRAVVLSRSAKLMDSREIQRTRSAYSAPANQPPSVLQCDTVSDDTWISGTHLAEHMEAWTQLLTGGRGEECTTQQEDNATVAVLARASSGGRVDSRRVLVMRTGSDFDRPPPGGSSADNLLGLESQGGFGPAVANLYQAGNPVVDEIATHWDDWEKGVPVK